MIDEIMPFKYIKKQTYQQNGHIKNKHIKKWWHEKNSGIKKYDAGSLNCINRVDEHESRGY